MLATNIPYLHCRNGIYYYRNQSTWKSLKTRCKRDAFIQLSKIVAGVVSATEKSSPEVIAPEAKSASPSCHTSKLIQAYLKENGHRWCAREYTRINSVLAVLPKSEVTREKAIELKQVILSSKTVTTFNRYVKYFRAFYRWVIANNPEVTVNPFDGLKVIEKKASAARKRNAYTREQMATLFKLANKYGNKDIRFWLIMIGRYTGARMNEICQLKPNDVTSKAIHIRGDILKTENAKRSIPTHPKLIELGLLDWVSECSGDRLFHEWRPVKGSFSHAGSRWFSRNNPFRSNSRGGKAEVDFHSLRHTVATELKQAGIVSQYAAQILGHSNGNITYDRYGKDVHSIKLVEAIAVIGESDSLNRPT